MGEEVNEIKVLLAKIAGEIALGEERLANKLGKTEHLQCVIKIRSEFHDALQKVDNKISSLYIKVAALSGGSAGIVGLAIKVFT